MLTVRAERTAIRTSQDVVNVRHLVRGWCLAMEMGLVDLTKVVTAASEIARNTMEYGMGGSLMLEEVRNGLSRGLRLTFEDQGPGIDDLARAMTDGYSSGDGLGLGLGGTKRLIDEFAIESAPGRGTRVVITKWKRR